MADRLEDIQALLKMYDKPPLDQFVDSPEIAELITRLKGEEGRLICDLPRPDH
jgi:hypothetical protein